MTRIIERSFHTETPEERERWVKAIIDTKRLVSAALLSSKETLLLSPNINRTF
jgi:hypothetical protein